MDTREANDYLAEVCRSHLILPELPDGRIWKTLRAVARYFSGKLFAPRVIEEFHCAPVKKRISAFLQANQIDLFVFSNSASSISSGKKRSRGLTSLAFSTP